MKKSKFLLITPFVLLGMFCFFSWGATVNTPGEKCITLSVLDADWYSVTAGYPDPIEIWSVVFYPSAQDDRMILNDGGADAAPFYDSGLCANKYDIKEPFIFPPGFKVRPYLDLTDCVLSVPGDAKVKIYFR